MAETWPSALQDVLNQAGFSLKIGETAIRSDVDIGPVKVRRRFTQGIDQITGTIYLNKDDYATFRTFFDTTLNGGVNTFNYVHPLTEATAEFRFVNPPTIATLGGEYFTIQMVWEEVN